MSGWSEIGVLFASCSRTLGLRNRVRVSPSIRDGVILVCALAVENRPSPDQAAAYWKSHIAGHPYFNSGCECLVVFILNTRRRIKGHYLVSIGTMDTIAHNYPSGEPTPSEADIKITRDLIRAGQLLKIEVLDHIVIGHPTNTSLRNLGYFL